MNVKKVKLEQPLKLVIKEDKAYLFFKRLIDVLGSTIGLIMLFIYGLIKAIQKEK